MTSKDIPFPFLESRVPSGLRSSTISPTKNQMTFKKKSEINKLSMKQNKTRDFQYGLCVIPVSGGSLEADRWSPIHWNRKHLIILIWIPIITFFLDACTDMRVIGIKRLVYGPWTTHYYNNYHNNYVVQGKNIQYIIIVSIPKHNLSNTCIYFKRTGKNALHPKLNFSTAGYCPPTHWEIIDLKGLWKVHSSEIGATI